MRTKILIFPLVLFMLFFSVAGVFASDGFFVLGGGKVDYISNDPLLNGNAWSVNIVQNGGGQSLVGTFAPKDIVDATDGVIANHSFTVTGTLVSESVSWNIKSSNFNLYEWSDVRINVLLYPFKSLETIGKEKCFDVYGSKAIDGNILWTKGVSSDMFCLYASKKVSVGGLSADSYKAFESKFSVVSNGQTVSGVITDKQSNVWLGDKVNVAFVGGVDSLYSVGSPSQLSFIWINGAWRPVDSILLSDVKAQETIMLNCLKYINRDTKYEECLTPYKSAFSNNLGYKSVSIDGGGVARITGGLTDGKYVIPMSALKPATYPLINLRIDADWIGVVRMVGQPKITGFGSDKNVNTGSVLNERVTVQNIGGFSGVFDVYATCGSPLSSSGKVRTSQLQPLAQEDVFITITGSCSSDKSASCTFTAVDVNNPNMKYTVAKSYTCKTIVTCVPDAIRCNGNVIEKCKSDGSDYATLNTCPNGCDYDKSGNVVCKETPQGCSSKADCKVNESCIGKTCVPDENLVCESSFFGLVDAQIGVKEECNFWCKVGLKQPEKINVCVKDYTPLVLVIATVLILGGMLLFANLKGKGKSKSGGRKSNALQGETAFWKNKTFWIVLVIIGAVFFVIGNIKFFFWALVVLLVLGIVFGLIFRKSVWKRIKRMIEGD